MEIDRKVKLVGHSGTAFRVQIALKIKGVEYELIKEEPEEPSAYKDLAETVLYHGDRTITGSLNIIEYIDEVWEGNPIMPVDPYERAVVRQWCHFVEGKLASSAKLIFTTTGTEMATGVEKLREDFNEIERELRDGHFKGRRFFGGDKLGTLDIIFGSGCFHHRVLDDLANTTILDPILYPLITALLADFKEQDVVKSIPIPDQDTRLVHYRKVKEAMLLSLKSGDAVCKRALIVPAVVVMFVLVFLILLTLMFIEKKKYCSFCCCGGGSPLISMSSGGTSKGAIDQA